MSGTTTLEVRWFADGELPDRLLNWFGDRCPGETLQFPERRTDTYLALPESTTTNIKQRQGRLELKWRQTTWGTQAFGDWQGALECWTKWDCSTLAAPTEVRGWFEVRKTRWQRQHRQVRYELAQVEVPGHCGWSIACELEVAADGATAGDREACGNRDRRQFVELVTQLTQTDPPHRFGDRLSASYPQWLKPQAIARLDDRP